MPENVDAYVQGVREGNRRVLSKTITLIESANPAHQRLGQEIIDRLLPYTGNVIRLGVSGVPGVGKSTFIETLGNYLIEKNHHVAVLAVDPSSRRSGGSIMADKTRMEKLSMDRRAFIRPSPSSGTLGGVARKTRETMLVCEAAGFDVTIVETVGVGQSETEVASMVDFFLVLLLAGAGDEIQGIKKGVLELADALVVNKADGDNVARAERARRVFENALHFMIPVSNNWTPPVLTCSALESIGIETVWEIVLDHRQRLMETGELTERRQNQAIDWVKALVEEKLKSRFYSQSTVQEMLPEIYRSVKEGTLNATTAAEQILSHS